MQPQLGHQDPETTRGPNDSGRGADASHSNPLIARCPASLPTLQECDSVEFVRLQFAACIAHAAHEGEWRKTGEPYIRHPERVVQLLRSVGVVDPNTLSAAYLHDAIESKPAELTETKLVVNQGLQRSLVTIVSMLTKNHYRSIDEYYVGIRGSEPATLIKVADRIDNIRTMRGAFAAEKAREYIRETEDYVLPLCALHPDHLGPYSDALRCLESHLNHAIADARVWTNSFVGVDDR